MKYNSPIKFVLIGMVVLCIGAILVSLMPSSQELPEAILKSAGNFISGLRL